MTDDVPELVGQANDTLERIESQVQALVERPDKEINVDARSTVNVEPTPVNITVESAKPVDVSVSMPSPPLEWLVTIVRDKDKMLSSLKIKAIQ